MVGGKVGIVGFGYWGKNQARVFHELNSLSGIYEENLQNIKKNKSYNFFDSLDQLLMHQMELSFALQRKLTMK